MIDDWVEMALKFAVMPADFYSGARKIIRRQVYTFPDLGTPHNHLKLADAGYTTAKAKALRRLYRHEDSISVCKALWEKRNGQAKYGSVGFTTYNHFVKGTGNSEELVGTSKRSSVMGPCIQSVVLTLLNDKTTSIDCFYRTTELFKKFPADLVFLRDDLLAGFDLGAVSSVNFYFANVTCHPMYFVTVLPSIPDPIRFLDRLERVDPYFYKWVVKWTARYVCKEYGHGIEKFSQALRVRKDAYERLDATLLPELQQYLRDNHPGYRGDETVPELQDSDS